MIFYRHSKNTKAIKALIPINEDFGFVIGGLLSEGWLSERSEFTNTDEKLAEKFFHLAKRVFGSESVYLSPATKRKAPRRPRYVVILSKVIGLFFKEIGLQGKSGEKRIPNFLFHSSVDCVSGLLRGYHLGDGYIYKNRKKRDFYVRLYTNSKELADGLNLLLLRLGILTKIREDKKSGYNSLWKDNYILSITGASNLEKYFRIVLEEELRLNDVSSSREVIPEVPKLIKQILQKYSVKLSHINIHKDSFNRNVRENRISIQYLKKIIRKLSNLVKDEDIEKFKVLINSDIYWDKIKDIRKLTPPKYVYDLEVDVKDELVNNFLGGSGLVCLHNTSYRLARIDKRKYPNIITAGKEVPYYTNSTLLPVNRTEDVIEALEHQEELQTLYTGGTVFHIFLGERMSSGEAAKRLLKKIAYNSRIPYITITPTYSICPDHGYLIGEHSKCSTCGKVCDVYSRVVGYFRPVRNWNEGKQEEFKQRLEYKEKIALEKDFSEKRESIVSSV
jgi:anaerobic ribonucleoside-triphosphate reductase